MKRYRRYDFACPFVLRDEAPSRTVASATRTPEGYLQVDGYLARSGTLEYSDGVETWTEYRPKAAIKAAAASWLRTPVTDEHPDDMVDASNWTQLAKGHLVQSVNIETLADGEDYIRASLLVTDSALVAKIVSGNGPRELSIGFSAAIVPTDGTADDGTRCDAVQLQLEGNHVAVVSKGRAGPAARLIMDGAAYRTMSPKNQRPQLHADEIGALVDTVEITGPNGEPFMAPTWLAAAYESLEAQPPPPEPGPAPSAPQDAAGPTTTTIEIEGVGSIEVPADFAQWVETPAGAAALEQAMAEQAQALDSADVTRAFMKRNGYDAKGPDEVTSEFLARQGYGDKDVVLDGLYRDHQAAQMAAVATRQDSADEDEDNHPTAEFMRSQGYDGSAVPTDPMLNPLYQKHFGIGPASGGRQDSADDDEAEERTVDFLKRNGY